MPFPPIGPRLVAVLDAQTQQDEALRYPNIEGYALAIATAAREIHADLLWPVGDGAHTLLGAVEIITRGAFARRGWDSMVAGRRVLLVGTVGVTGVEISAAAQVAAIEGAVEVHACAIDEVLAVDSLASFRRLTLRDACSQVKSA